MTPLSPNKNKTKKPREICLESELNALGKENLFAAQTVCQLWRVRHPAPWGHLWLHFIKLQSVLGSRSSGTGAETSLSTMDHSLCLHA